VAPAKKLLALAYASLAAATLSCGSEGGGDPPVDKGAPAAAGPDARIREIADPQSPKVAKHLDAVAVSGAVVIAVDTFDETENGRSRGTIYVQDIGTAEPYSGVSLFGPTFVPGNLKVGVGDVLDLRGTYQQNTAIGTAQFAPGAFLPQISQPIATFRGEYRAPDPKDIDIGELATFEGGRKWNGMLVRVRNVTVEDVIGAKSVRNGRLGVNLLPTAPGAANGCDAPFPKPPTVVNALANLSSLEIPAKTTLKSITGIVAFFCNFQLAPRAAADIER
jgi:hypothetical protein